ncbi:hypothetical protein L596_017875 [Steinernema carpocapsae]|uniref:Uncharacterized protein n=1 Tax=Steinernema carpocapsae TaxID=34508 RepID=A0A4U5N394_STECR|nr:hypothetical protein L596_017875 [Steinernema carpocapsae]
MDNLVIIFWLKTRKSTVFTRSDRRGGPVGFATATAPKLVRKRRIGNGCGRSYAYWIIHKIWNRMICNLHFNMQLNFYERRNRQTHGSLEARSADLKQILN